MAAVLLSTKFNHLKWTREATDNNALLSFYVHAREYSQKPKPSLFSGVESRVDRFNPPAGLNPGWAKLIFRHNAPLSDSRKPTKCKLNIYCLY